jgi:hypothetical protein
MNLMMSVAPQGGNFRVNNFYNKDKKEMEQDVEAGCWHEMHHSGQAFFFPLRQ